MPDPFPLSWLLCSHWLETQLHRLECGDRLKRMRQMSLTACFSQRNLPLDARGGGARKSWGQTEVHRPQVKPRIWDLGGSVPREGRR